MRHFLLNFLFCLPTMSVAAAAAPPANVGDILADRRAAWSAEDGVGELSATPVATPVHSGVPGAPVTPRKLRSAADDDDTTTQFENDASTQVAVAAGEARHELVRAKLAAAEAIAARAASGESKRVALVEFQLLVQRATCAAAHGELDRGEGAACMAKPAVGRDVNLDDNEEAQLCNAQGGVLVARMDACLRASTQLAGMHAEQEASVGLEALIGAFAEVARQCWGQTLCVE